MHAFLQRLPACVRRVFRQICCISHDMPPRLKLRHMHGIARAAPGTWPSSDTSTHYQSHAFVIGLGWSERAVQDRTWLDAGCVGIGLRSTRATFVAGSRQEIIARSWPCSRLTNSLNSACVPGLYTIVCTREYGCHSKTLPLAQPPFSKCRHTLRPTILSGSSTGHTKSGPWASHTLYMHSETVHTSHGHRGTTQHTDTAQHDRASKSHTLVCEWRMLVAEAVAVVADGMPDAAGVDPDEHAELERPPKRHRPLPFPRPRPPRPWSSDIEPGADAERVPGGVR